MEPAGMGPFAKRVEQLGFDSLWVTDHIAVPVNLPASTGRGRSWSVYQRNMLDAIGMLHYLAAVTDRIALGTGVMVLPYRHPVTLAKQIASADQLSRGRVIFGAAAGYMEDEFRVLNADFANRGAVTDESLEVIRACWSDTEPSVKTDRFQVDGVAYSPLPVPRAGGRLSPPIWIGGLSRPAMRRAVRHDGWHGMAPSFDALTASIAYLREESERVGRASPLTISLRATWYESSQRPFCATRRQAWSTSCWAFPRFRSRRRGSSWRCWLRRSFGSCGDPSSLAIACVCGDGAAPLFCGNGFARTRTQANVSPRTVDHRVRTSRRPRDAVTAGRDRG
jgi:probable F420-dependent oxidoreductase